MTSWIPADISRLLLPCLLFTTVSSCTSAGASNLSAMGLAYLLMHKMCRSGSEANDAEMTLENYFFWCNCAKSKDRYRPIGLADLTDLLHARATSDK